MPFRERPLLGRRSHFKVFENDIENPSGTVMVLFGGTTVAWEDEISYPVESVVALWGKRASSETRFIWIRELSSSIPSTSWLNSGFQRTGAGRGSFSRIDIRLKVIPSTYCKLTGWEDDLYFAIESMDFISFVAKVIDCRHQGITGWCKVSMHPDTILIIDDNVKGTLT